MFHLYGLVIGIAVVVGWSIAERIEPKVNRIAPLMLVVGILGARAWHVIEAWSYYSTDWGLIFRVWEGGLSIWGAILGGGLVWAGAGRQKSILIALVTALPFSQAIGRVANGINGEFVMKVMVLPWWAMEAVLDLILGMIIWRAKGEKRVGIYLIGYGVIRLLLSYYRQDSVVPTIIMIMVGSYLLWQSVRESHAT